MKCIDRLPGKPYNGNCIQGPDSREEIAKHVQPQVCYKLEEVLTIKKGCRVMSIENLCTPWGIVNGSMGTVYDVILNEDKELE